jgi:hypothetical protein
LISNYKSVPNWDGPSRSAALRESRYRIASSARARAIKLVALVVAATVLLVPFDAVVNVAALGELSHDSYAIFNLALAPIVILILLSTGSLHVPRSLAIILCLILFGILTSLVPNLGSILEAFARGRHGGEKFITAAIIPVFGMYISLLIYLAVLRHFRACFLRPLLWSSFIVILGGILQIAAVLAPSLRALSARVFLITHAGFDRFDTLSNRLADSSNIGSLRVTSTLFEPADFGTYAIYVLPWVLSALLCFEFTRGRTMPLAWTRVAFLIATLLLLILAMFSGRTAALGAPAIIGIYLGLCVMLKIAPSGTGARLTSLLIVTGAILLYLLPLWLVSTFADVLVRGALASGNTSNISRLGTVVILLDLFRDNPFFGVGMGQYGFYVARYVPAWAYTFEFKRWIGDVNASFFPSFAVFARIAGEMGLVGLMIWVGFLAALLQKVWIRVWALYRETGRLPYFGIAITANFFSLGITGLGMASYRVFWIWALLGLAAAYLSSPSSIDAKRNS